MQSGSTDESDRNRTEDVPVPELPTPSNTSIWGKTRKALNEVSAQASSAGGTLASKAVNLGTSGATKTAEATRGAIETGKQAYSGSKLESAVDYIDGELDQRGAKKAIKDSTGAVVGKLDQFTGKRLVELLEEKLRAQDEYNDVLATRLAEALERIAKLEARFNED